MSFNIYCGFESLIAGNGGIARVARLMLKALIEEAENHSFKIGGICFNGDIPINYGKKSFISAYGSKIRYLSSVQKASLSYGHFIYDFLGMARAHCQIPFLRRPFMSWVHGIEIWENARKDRIKWARRANVLISNSQFTMDRMQLYHGDFKNLKVCWLGTETDDVPRLCPKEGTPPVVLMISRLDKNSYKGHEEIIKSWNIVVSAIPDAKLVIIGNGPGYGYLKDLAANAATAFCIDFRGFISEEEIENVWAEASVFAMPSRGEGFGLVYIEAMRHRLPIIASVHDAGSEINVDGKTGFNVDMDKPGELPERIIFLLKNRNKSIEMGKMGQEYWAKHFTYTAFKGRFVKVLNEFLNC